MTGNTGRLFSDDSLVGSDVTSPFINQINYAHCKPSLPSVPSKSWSPDLSERVSQRIKWPRPGELLRINHESLQTFVRIFFIICVLSVLHYFYFCFFLCRASCTWSKSCFIWLIIINWKCRVTKIFKIVTLQSCWGADCAIRSQKLLLDKGSVPLDCSFAYFAELAL